MKIYIVVELLKDAPPRLIGAYKNKAEAEKEAAATTSAWRNVIKSILH